MRIIIECPERILHLEAGYIYADCTFAQLQTSCSSAADHTLGVMAIDPQSAGLVTGVIVPHMSRPVPLGIEDAERKGLFWRTSLWTAMQSRRPERTLAVGVLLLRQPPSVSYSGCRHAHPDACQRSSDEHLPVPRQSIILLLPSLRYLKHTPRQGHPERGLIFARRGRKDRPQSRHPYLLSTVNAA